jgi:hypothetical protein
MEAQPKGKAQYSWPPSTNEFRSAALKIEYIIFVFYEMSYLNEEVKCTEPSPSVSVLWMFFGITTGGSIIIPLTSCLTGLD